MKRLILSAMLMLCFCGVALATPTVENIYRNGDWVNVDVNPVSIYGHSGSGTIVPFKLGSDGTVAVATSNSAYAVKIQQPDANHTYVGTAPVGTAQSAEAWQAKLITINGTTTTITWANGNSNFTNVATDLSGLTYN